MWNLTALAAKAQEAAARIERQLDDSVGLDGDVARAAAPSISVAHDDLNGEDAFFSDNRNHHGLSLQQEGVGGQRKDDMIKGPLTPVATKLDVNINEGEDFFGDDDPIGTVQAHADEKQKKVSGLDEAASGGDDGGGDGRVESGDISIDDHQLSGPMQQGNVDVQGDISINPHESEPIMQAEAQANSEEYVQHCEVFSHGPQNHAGVQIMSSRDTLEVPSDFGQKELVNPQPQVDQIHSCDGNDAGFFSEDAVVGVGSRSLQTECSIPTENDQVDSLSQDDEFPSAAPEKNPQMVASPMGDTKKEQFLATIADLEAQISRREDQLASKSDQITSLSLQHESETASLRQVIVDTKEEARKRVVRAKERVEEMQGKLTEAVRRADAAGGSSRENADVITALRAEGEQLARKQSQMEQAVRNAKGEARELQEKLDAERVAHGKETMKSEAAERAMKCLKEELSSARKGESQSKKLEEELVAAREESEKQRATNLVLEQQLRELKEETKFLKKEVHDAKEGAALELEGESNKLRKERDDMLGDLESKLRMSEREANVREDALRHEVSELRKRWQDAVRRAEDLSMDVQHSTAPLLRQLESTERQNRARATTWAELETKLRSDLENHVIQSERLTKERNNLIASDKRSQRLLKEKDDEITSSQETIDVLSMTIENLETKVEALEEGRKEIKQELLVANRKVSEGASKVRNEMMQAVIDSEERYQSQIDSLEKELDEARKMRSNLEKQIDDLAESVAAAEFAQGERSLPVKEKRLRSAENQASILHDTLVGIDSDVDGDDSDEDGLGEARGQGSFAAMEQLSLGLKGATLELEALRKQLTSSEETRESLVEELGEARQAVEKLPLFEQKVNDLTMDVKLKEMEIQGLQDDICDVRFLYRSQLDALLEEKASSHIEVNREEGSPPCEN